MVFLLFPIFRRRNSKPGVGNLTMTGLKKSNFKQHSQHAVCLFQSLLLHSIRPANFIIYLARFPTHVRHQTKRYCVRHCSNTEQIDSSYPQSYHSGSWNENNTDYCNKQCPMYMAHLSIEAN